jgi:HEAT repeats
MVVATRGGKSMGLYYKYQICPHCGKKCSEERESLEDAIAQMTTIIPEGYRCNKCNKTISSDAMIAQNQGLEEELIQVISNPMPGLLGNITEASNTLSKIGGTSKTVAALYSAAIFGARHEFGGGIREAAVNALSEIGKRNSSVRVFLGRELAFSADEKVLAVIVDILADICDPRDAETLIGFLSDGNSIMQNRAAGAIRKMGVSAVEPLVKALGDHDWKVRAGAAKILGEICDKMTLEPLISCLADKHEDVRAEAASALSRLCDQRAIAPLLENLRDDTKKVRKQAANALTRITKNRFFFDNMNIEKWQRWWDINKANFS